MSWRRASSPGWASVDLNKQGQKQKHGLLELEANADPYPPMSSTITPLRPRQNFVEDDGSSIRSFSSLLIPPGNIQSLTDNNRETKVPSQVGNSSGRQGNEFIEENSVVQTHKKLKELHCWAEKSLIEDVMAAVGNDVDKASSLLQAMISSNSVQENKETKIAAFKSNTEEILPENNDGFPVDKDDSLLKAKYNFNYISNEWSELIDSYGQRLPDNNAHMKRIFSHLSAIPVEPEWEEDDIYLIHRKDALRMMRSASQNSRAACGAYIRGDHFSAQQFSLKAREEWMAAERLNSKAAKEILSARNCKNDLWKLDLHGLHEEEAVQALQEHLQKIETEEPLNRIVRPCTKGNVETGSGNSASICLDMQKFVKQQSSSRQRSASLEVITGKGNHSRGQAALPVVIRSFLNENRYRFDEARPGVITVWPKFLHQ